MNRTKVGSWELPSGGVLDIWVEGDLKRVGGNNATCEWPTWPPDEADLQYYVTVVAPVIAQRVMARLGREGGRALWIQR